MEWWRLREDQGDRVVRFLQEAVGCQGIEIKGSPLFSEVVCCIQGQVIYLKRTDVQLL